MNRDTYRRVSKNPRRFACVKPVRLYIHLDPDDTEKRDSHWGEIFVLGNYNSNDNPVLFSEEDDGMTVSGAYKYIASNEFFVEINKDE